MKSTKIVFLFLALVLNFIYCGKQEKNNRVEVPKPETDITSSKIGVVEGFPDEIVQKMLKIDEMRRKRNEKLVMGGAQISSVSSLDDRRWRPGTVLTVAFKGGDSTLYKKISSAAQEWTMFGNIKMDFGFDPATDSFRQWRESDQTYAADIRISFDKTGYWSHVGLDCIDPAISGSSTASTNFEGFTSELPSDYKGTVIHEFGHALGFQHEHQTPAGTCENEFDWPKVYKYMWDEYEWSQVDIDYNFRKLPYESAYPLTEYDPKSIMNYYLPWQVYKNGKKSICFFGQRIVELSQNDKVGMSIAYPYDEKAIMEYDVKQIEKRVLLKKNKIRNN